ncbi:MAG TPA: hypothetical protein VF057_13365 [Thermoanaerobaculia bacterium]
MRRAAAVILCIIAFSSCAKREPLTEAKAEEILRSYGLPTQPTYAEVPQRVWWNPKFPKDDYDEKALRTLRNLEKAGFVAVSGSETADSGEYIGKVTERGFRILGTTPSARGPAFRARLCDRVYDGLRNFQRHPSEETTGYGDLIWHYANPTPLYEMFETKMNKPLNTPFASQVAFYYKEGEWRFEIAVAKTSAETVPAR